MTSQKPIKAAIVPALMVSAGLIWGAVYVRSVAENPRHDAAALALIGPLIWIVFPLGLLIIAQAVLQARQGKLDEAHELQDPKRQIYLIALLLFLCSLPWLGILGAGLPFFAGLAYALGFRRLVSLGLTAFGIVALIWGGFVGLLGVDLNLLPGAL